MTRVFGVDYAFRACGDVFTQGLAHAADALGLAYAHADWTDAQAPRIKAFAPDLLFVVHGRQFARHRLTRIRPPGACQTAVWLLDEPYEVDETASWSGQFDRVFVNDPATLDRHPRSMYLPVCYNPVVHFPLPPDAPDRRPYGVGFIGGGNESRDRYLGALADRKLLDYVIGGPWSHAGLRVLSRALNIPAAQTATWYRGTRIVLNLWRVQHHYNREHLPATSLNPRIYEALACGALVVSEWRPEIEAVVPELPTFRTEAECVAVVSALLADPDLAEQTRAACQARIAPHTYAARLAAVLDVCAEARAS